MNPRADSGISSVWNKLSIGPLAKAVILSAVFRPAQASEGPVYSAACIT